MVETERAVTESTNTSAAARSGAPRNAGSADTDASTVDASALRLGTKRSSYADVIGQPLMAVADRHGWPAPSHTAIDAYDLDWCAIRGVSIRGEAKRFNSEGRQDTFEVRRMPRGAGRGDAIAIAVADGLGSCDLSHVGAELACRAALDAVANSADALEVSVEAVTGAAANAINRWALEEQVDPLRLSTTLALAVLAPVGSLVHAWALAIGDSAVRILAPSEGRDPSRQTEGEAALQPVAKSQSDSLASNKTAALPSHAGPAVSGRIELSAGNSIALATDGALALLDLPDIRDQYIDLLTGTDVPSPPHFLWWVDARIKTYDDDRTLVCVWVLSDAQ